MAIEKDPNDPLGILLAVKSNVPGGTTEESVSKKELMSEQSKGRFFSAIREVFKEKLNELELNKTLESIANSIQSAASKTVSSVIQSSIPNVSKELQEISEKFVKGQDKDYEEALNRLAKIVEKTGVNLYDFSNKLGKNFDKLTEAYEKRKERLNELEEEKEILKEKNIYTKIVDNQLTKEKELKILTNKEQKQEINNIFKQEKILKDEEKKFEREKNILLKKETLTKNEQKFLLDRERSLKEESQILEKRKTDINYGERRPTGIRAGFQTAGQFIRGERGSDTTRLLMGSLYQQITAPIEALKTFKDQIIGVGKFMKDLGAGLFRLTALFGRLILAIMPFLIPVTLVTVGLFGLYMAAKKIANLFGFGKGDEEKAKSQQKAYEGDLKGETDMPTQPGVDEQKSSKGMLDKIMPDTGAPETDVTPLRRKRETLPEIRDFATLNKDYMIEKEIAATSKPPIITNIAPTNVANSKSSETIMSPDVFNNDPTFLNLNVRTV